MRLSAALAICLVLALPATGFGDQNDPALDGLFARLQAAESDREAGPIEARIWQMTTTRPEDRLVHPVPVGGALPGR